MGLGLRRILLEDAIAGSGAVHLGNAMSGVTVYVQANGWVPSDIVIEEARSTDYRGVWSTLHVIEHLTTDTVQAIHMSAPLLALRARIAQPIEGGGSVTVEVVAN
jgi:hypothetical protein